MGGEGVWGVELRFIIGMRLKKTTKRFKGRRRMACQERTYEKSPTEVRLFFAFYCIGRQLGDFNNLLCGNQLAFFRRLLERFDLVEVHVTVDLR